MVGLGCEPKCKQVRDREMAHDLLDQLRREGIKTGHVDSDWGKVGRRHSERKPERYLPKFIMLRKTEREINSTG